MEKPFRFAAGCWLLSAYLAPHTFLGYTSPMAQLSLVATNTSSVARNLSTLILLVSSIVVLVRICRQTVPENRTAAIGKTVLILLFVAYSAFVFATPWLYRSGPSSVVPIHSILVSVSTGVISTLVFGDLGVLIYGLCFLALVEGGYAFALLASGSHVLHSGNVVRLTGTFNDVGSLATLASVAVALATARALSERVRLRNLLFVSCAVVLSLTLLLTWSRGAIVATAAAAVWLATTSVRSRKLVATVGLTSVLLVATCFLYRSGGAENAASSNRSIDGHFYLMAQGWHCFLTHWRFGVGAGVVEFSRGNVFYTEPKNLYLYWLDQAGILGGSAIAGYCVALYGVLKQSINKDFGKDIVAFWIVIAISGLFDTPVFTPQMAAGNALFGCMIAGTLLLGKSVLTDRPEPAVVMATSAATLRR